MNRSVEPNPEIGDLSPDGLHYWDGDVWRWQPLWLTPDQVIAAVRQCFGQSGSSACLLAAGLLNQSWRVDTDQGACVLRISRPERSRAQVAYEHAVTQALKLRVSVVVPPLPGRDGETVQHWRARILSLFPFVEGLAGTAMNPVERGQQAATVLAQIHRASLDHLQFGQRPGFRSVDEHPRWVWSAVKPILRQELTGADDLNDLFDTLDREVASLDAWLDDLHASQRPLMRAIVHGDFNPRNLIFQDSRIAAVIDWDECRFDVIAWEVAQVGFGTHGIDPVEFWRVYLDAGGPLAPQDVDLLSGFARMGNLSELQWTVDDGRATPHAIDQLREVVAGIVPLREREVDVANR